jgi:hypothetical protein
MGDEVRRLLLSAYALGVSWFFLGFLWADRADWPSMILWDFAVALGWPVWLFWHPWAE